MLSARSPGCVCSVVLVVALGNALVGVVLGTVVGLGYGLAVGPRSGSYIDNGMAAAALGVPLWAALSVILLPLAAGEEPSWTTEGMRLAFPAFVGWVLYSGSLGLAARALADFAPTLLGPEPQHDCVAARGDDAHRHPGRRFCGGNDGHSSGAGFRRRSVHLVDAGKRDERSAFHADAGGGGGRQPGGLAHQQSAAHQFATHGRHSRTGDGDRPRAALRAVGLAAAMPWRKQKEAEGLAYDHLVLALGAVSSYLGMSDVQAAAFDFKSLADAIRIRNHVIDLFERADGEPDAEVRGPMLTFVVAGGGFAGAELAGSLNDFTRGMLAYYPNIPPDEVKVVLVHSRERILPELSEPLAAYALRQMAARGVTFKLNTRVRGAREGVVLLQPDEELRTRTLVWTAGTAPHPFLKTLPVQRSPAGRRDR